MLKNIHLLQQASEIISGKFPRTEVKLFHMYVDEGRDNFISHVTTALW